MAATMRNPVLAVVAGAVTFVAVLLLMTVLLVGDGPVGRVTNYVMTIVGPLVGGAVAAMVLRNRRSRPALVAFVSAGGPVTVMGGFSLFSLSRGFASGATVLGLLLTFLGSWAGGFLVWRMSGPDSRQNARSAGTSTGSYR